MRTGDPFLSFPLTAERSYGDQDARQEERKGKESRIRKQDREAILSEWRKGTAPSAIPRVLRRASNYYYLVQQVIAEEEERLAQAQEEPDGTDGN